MQRKPEVSSPHLLQNVDSDFSSVRVFPSVPFDSGSSKENPTAQTSAVKEHIHPEAMDEREVDKVADTPITIQDASFFVQWQELLFLTKH
jgi:hypothetical protein